MRLLFIGFFLISKMFYSQDKTNIYLPSDINKTEVYLEKVNKAFINEIHGKYASKIKKVFKNRSKKVLKTIKDSTYIFSPIIIKNLNHILDNIYNANPGINPTHYNFFIKNSIVPNAGCYGDGMFEINLGLFTLLKSDDELAFVICHEIAHKLLNHSLKKVKGHIVTLNSKETKSKVRKLRAQKYGRTRSALSIIDDLNIDILDHSKEAEIEADSLGFLLFSKTAYNKNNAIKSLKKLDFTDNILFNYNVRIDSVFNFNQYPFKSFWLKKPTSLFNTNKKIDEFELASDTLKTHPEINYRIDVLKEKFKIKTQSSTGIVSNINTIKKEAHLKSIQYTIDLKYLDLAIYQLIKKRNKGQISSDYYYKKMITVLKFIYNAKKNHELGKYVPPSNDFSDEKQLNLIRLFLRNLEINEVKKIIISFCETHNKVKTNSFKNK